MSTARFYGLLRPHSSTTLAATGYAARPAASDELGALCSTAYPALCIPRWRSAFFVAFPSFLPHSLRLPQRAMPKGQPRRANETSSLLLPPSTFRPDCRIGLSQAASHIGRARRPPAYYLLPRPGYTSSGFFALLRSRSSQFILSTRAATGYAKWPAASGGRASYLRLPPSPQTEQSGRRAAARLGGSPCASIPETVRYKPHLSPRARPTKQ